QCLDLFRLVDDVETKDLRSACRRRMKSEQRVNQRRLAGAVWTEQTDCFTAQIATQVFENLSTPKSNAETMQVDHGRLRVSRLSFDRFARNRSGECHTLSYNAVF